MKNKSIILAALLVLLVSSKKLSVKGHLPPVTVIIVTGLTEGVCGVHCVTNNADLGERLLFPPGQGFNFTFHPNTIGYKRFHCHVRLPNGVERNFKIYDQKRDRACGAPRLCVWQIRLDGPCEKTGSSTWFNKCFPWDN
ncbi:hypothetical protein M5689_011635 [Euphorbia peplus]|nr:hypothetical protein M5689_011635 [Euphorbia peplus]